MEKNTMVLGSGITGLSAGVDTNDSVYEAKDIAGGICISYYIDLNGGKNYIRKDPESYRFEIGGGHWIFGGDKEISDYIDSHARVKSYVRRSSVYFPDMDLYVPYPLQNHLFSLPQEIREKALNEILNPAAITVNTLEDWLEANFGKTLCDLFFFPFHKLYTADLYTKIAPQDKFKTPVDKDLIIKGAKEKTPPTGYNATFLYPEEGLDTLIREMASKCKINFNEKIVRIDMEQKEVFFEDGRTEKYENAISTLSLNNIVKMTGIEAGTPDPYTSVLVVNIGAKKGTKCPDDHWIYVPDSKTGFHRIGFYSNVDESFLPLSSRGKGDRVSIYVEKAFMGGEKLSKDEMEKISADIVNELTEWNIISDVDVVDHTWIDIAYTWQYPDSDWKAKSIETLRENSIYQIGRYGKWKFQGIVESIRDGIGIRKLINSDKE